MAIYYVNLDSPGAWNGRGGTNHTGDEWLGLSGLQKAADTITAGNSIHIKGTVVCTNLKNITYDNLVGSFTIGEEVQIDASNKGIVSEDTGTILTVEVTAGTFNNNDTMTGQTSGATADVNVTVAVKSVGLDVDTNAGAIPTGRVKFIGVNGSWVNDGTRCKLDGNAGVVAGCLDIVKRSVDWLYFENVEVDDADDKGFEYVGNPACLFVNCWAHHCDSSGFQSYQNDTFIRCLSTNNGGHGFYAYNARNRYVLCVAHNNSENGFNLYSSREAIFSCISAENTQAGISDNGGDNIVFFNTIDENADGISKIGGTRLLALFNRITNQTDDGIVATAGEQCYEDWNLFYGNVGNNRDDTAGAGLIEQGGNSKTDGAADGYANQAGHDFNLTDAADYRREAITLPKWDGTSP